MGNVTQVFLELGASVICVEPQSACLCHLYKRFKNNKKIIIVKKAIGSHEGYSELLICKRQPAISTLSNKWTVQGRFANDYKWTKTENVPVITLDKLILEYGLPKFCKIDVEGYEESVLKGLSNAIPVISFEFTKEFFYDLKKCIDYLLTIGRMEFNCSINGNYGLLFTTWVSPDALYDNLSAFKNGFLWGDIYARLY